MFTIYTQVEKVIFLDSGRKVKRQRTPKIWLLLSILKTFLHSYLFGMNLLQNYVSEFCTSRETYLYGFCKENRTIKIWLLQPTLIKFLLACTNRWNLYKRNTTYLSFISLSMEYVSIYKYVCVYGVTVCHNISSNPPFFPAPQGLLLLSSHPPTVCLSIQCLLQSFKAEPVLV